MQKYSQARDYLEQNLAQEAEEKIAGNLRRQAENEQKIQEYDRAVSGINSCLQAMKLHEHLLPVIREYDTVFAVYEGKDIE